MTSPLENEANTLAAILGLPAAPVFLDIKPPDLLTADERWLFAERLAEVEAAQALIRGAGGPGSVP